ncbi:unnamed protein product (macronuclear) [Paramecium tetraurelia]|uniref:Uncharacterized protein n=1 Tax=Paramecium tetraurelia TaxID=5888 RepID=A0BDU0_PARTE|nr:uncharacterized protein GSPATT00027737001 [Paramecium tetraurelia]CAK56707.1 unnamed protein product [Paramecium tetraurelia]|eukprot:XP_001424105.1 hypothetical protein (macronuclear) [Paramecium tetraurelia strain d4-2]
MAIEFQLDYKGSKVYQNQHIYIYQLHLIKPPKLRVHTVTCSNYIILCNQIFIDKFSYQLSFLNTSVSISRDVSSFTRDKYLVSRDIQSSKCSSNNSFLFHVSVINCCINHITSPDNRSIKHDIIIQSGAPLYDPIPRLVSSKLFLQFGLKQSRCYLQNTFSFHLFLHALRLVCMIICKCL